MSLDLDMQEIHEIFFEESTEGLDVMEAGLLGLDIGAVDAEVINNIFRAAHSIKGGAATFGFDAISDFTHGVETLLDQVRSGERQLTEQIVEIQLASVDCIRQMLDDLVAGRSIDQKSATVLKAGIDELLSQACTPARAPGESATCGSQKIWKIEFRPDKDLFRNGNEPQRIFAELATLGELDVRANLGGLPQFDQMDPEACYLGWTLALRTSESQAAIEEAFAWVGDQCDLQIELDEAVPVEAPEAAAKPGKSRSQSREGGSIRVSIEKIDALLNLVGELVISQSMLKRCGEEYSADNVNELRDGLMELERYTRELQENAMQIRMLPISVSFSRFPRLVRDQSAKLGKKVELRFSGEHTELDKTVLEKMSDPLVHLVRNSLDHGIESPEKRIAAGKPETGVLHLSASHEGGNIVIRVEDDGAGLNRDKILEKATERGLVSPTDSLTDDQIHNLIFQPGFSTADTVSDLSGRGVGMDVVRRNIIDLGGRLEIQSTPGQGSVLTIRLPLTLAILDGQLVQVDSSVYIFSLLSIIETVQVSKKDISGIVGGGQVFRLRDRYIPVVRLREAFGLGGPKSDPDFELLVIVECDGCQFGLFVDDLLEQQQVVIKSLEENYRKVAGLAGATILGDGRVALIIDVPSLFQSLIQSQTISFNANQNAA